MKKIKVLILLLTLCLALVACAGTEGFPGSCRDSGERFGALLVRLLPGASASGGGGTATGGTPNALPPVTGADATHYYYDQLDEGGRTVYRAILADPQNTAGIEIPLSGVLETFSSEEELQQTVSATVQSALDALTYDHPEICWIRVGGEGGSTFRVSSRTETTESGTVCRLQSLRFFMVCDGNAATVAEELRAAVVGFVPAGEDRYTTLSAIQSALCRGVTYTTGAPRAHSAAGALLDGSAVCDGYAKAFKLLCDTRDIPCVIVTGMAVQASSSEAHAWNYVQMEDGNWYAVDVTWDDRGEEVSDRFFLIGSGTVTSFQNGSFSASHQPSGKFSGGDYPPFTYPPLSFSRYRKAETAEEKDGT